MIVEDAEGTAAWGSRALELARALGDVESEVYALTNIATIELLAGAPSAVQKLERSLELARAAGYEEHAGRAFVALTWWAPRGRSYTLADGYLEPALEYCSERGLDLWRLYLLAYRARAALDRGGWDRAADDAALILQDPRSPAVPRIVALATLGLVRARRGDPDVWPPLDEAWLLAEPTTELQRIEPAAAARAEAAWLERRPEVVAEATTAPLELARRRQAWWVVGELASWRRRAGIADEPLPGVPDPYAAELAGDWPRAARAWGELDSPYEAALALAEADDEATLRRALEELEALGAQPAATFVRRTLHERGARGVRRGPRRSTQENPSGLTTRELEVLRLLAQGLRNSEIASRLVLSERTVDHHVAAILRKLGVRTRGQASAEAVKLGIAGQEG
jgi:DNA-binding CsgD family transcriptional regulator